MYSIKWKDLNRFIPQLGRSNSLKSTFELILRTNTLLVRKGNFFQFIHTSFMEYFTAKHVCSLIIKEHWDSLRDKTFCYEILEFLKYMIDENYLSAFHAILMKKDFNNLRQAIVELIGTAQMYVFEDILLQIAEYEENSLIRTEALISLGYLGRKDKLHDYVRNMRTNDELENENHNFILEYYTGEDRARNILHKRLNDPVFDNVRAFHIHTLAKIGNEKSITILSQYADHSGSFVSEEATIAIRKIKQRLKTKVNKDGQN